MNNLSRYEQLERTTENNLISEWTETMKDTVKEVIKYDFDGDKDSDFDDVYDIVCDRLHETIDGDQDVIYTANAKLICDILHVDIFDTDENTGERYNSWSHAAYCGIYNLIMDEVDTYQIIKDQLN